MRGGGEGKRGEWRELEIGKEEKEIGQVKVQKRGKASKRSENRGE